MKHQQFKYPLILRSLVEKGKVGKRKAHRMIKHAVFVARKKGEVMIDEPFIAAFCIWADQGKYRDSWVEASQNELA